MIVQGLWFQWLQGFQSILMAKHNSGWILGFLQHIEGVSHSPEGPNYYHPSFSEWGLPQIFIHFQYLTLEKCSVSDSKP